MKKLVFSLLLLAILLPATAQGKRNPLFPRQLGRSGSPGQKGKEKDLY